MALQPSDENKAQNKAEKIKRKKVKAAREQQRRSCRKRRRKEKLATVGKLNFRG